jgi:hypothetical protein
MKKADTKAGATGSKPNVPATETAIHPAGPGFAERVAPKVPSEEAGVFFNKCEGCGGIHFRHAGYIQSLVPFMRAGGEKKLSLENLNVMVCVGCRHCYVWLNEQMYDVTDRIDLDAWQKLEKDAHRATGPGGQC